MRRGIREWIDRYTLEAAIRDLAALGARRPTAQHFRRLASGFGNSGWAATQDLLDELAARSAAARVGILECGSGLSTLLIGALTKQSGVPVVSLEHHPEWHRRMSEILRRHGLHHVDLQLRPIRSYDGFDWYDLPALAAERRFDLVLCDGPPGDTRGGRHGLLPCLGDRFAKGCVLVVDDTHRADDDAVVTRWLENLPGATRTRRGHFTVVTLT
jgi:Methyltransferase domain